MAWVDTFLEVLLQETAESAEALVLGHVRQLVGEQSLITPVLFANENAVAQRHPDRLARLSTQLLAYQSKQPIEWRHLRHCPQEDPLWMQNVQPFSEVDLSKGKGHARFEDG